MREERSLTFFAFIVVENVRQDAPSSELKFVLWNTRIVDALLFAAQAGCSLRFNMKFLRCSCAWADDLYLRQGSLLKMENADACQAAA